jgi:hypothetical protein
MLFIIRNLTVNPLHYECYKTEKAEWNPTTEQVNI